MRKRTRCCRKCVDHETHVVFPSGVWPLCALLRSKSTLNYHPDASINFLILRLSCKRGYPSPRLPRSQCFGAGHVNWWPQRRLVHLQGYDPLHHQQRPDRHCRRSPRRSAQRRSTTVQGLRHFLLAAHWPAIKSNPLNSGSGRHATASACALAICARDILVATESLIR